MTAGGSDEELFETEMTKLAEETGRKVCNCRSAIRDERGDCPGGRGSAQISAKYELVARLPKKIKSVVLLLFLCLAAEGRGQTWATPDNPNTYHVGMPDERAPWVPYAVPPTQAVGVNFDPIQLVLNDEFSDYRSNRDAPRTVSLGALYTSREKCVPTGERFVLTIYTGSRKDEYVWRCEKDGTIREQP